jgi:hypothetical protein
MYVLLNQDALELCICSIKGKTNLSRDNPIQLQERDEYGHSGFVKIQLNRQALSFGHLWRFLENMVQNI